MARLWGNKSGSATGASASARPTEGVVDSPRRGQDAEIEQYRNLIETPTEFKDGFGWNTVVGILFCGLVMMPGSIYLGLMTGSSMGSAAQWVTVILFSEVARRSLKTMSKQNLVVLLHAAAVIMAGSAMAPGGPFGNLVYRAYLVTSDAIRDAGMRDAFPSWASPAADSAAITERNLLHKDWLVPIGLMFFLSIIGVIKKYTLGYFFFRLTSDIENLPFPMAPIAAQGAMAMAEEDEEPTADSAEADPLGGAAGPKKKSERWRMFALGAVLGIAFGFFMVGIPALTGLFFSQPFFLIPAPFIDTTTSTEALLPATPTGLTLDLGIIFIGFVLPFWAVIGTFLAIVLTMVLNPILHEFGVLTSWQPGMNTVNAAFANNVDFWLSFGIGAGLGIAAVSIYATIRDVRKKLRELRERSDDTAKQARRDLWATPNKGRGDYPLWMALAGYVAASTAVVVLCWILLPHNPGLLAFLIIFAFIYNPFISYVNARLLGIAGQTVDIPFIKEGAFILSGAQGIAVWLAPIPVENYGGQAQSFRVNELTGVSFWSLLKTDLVAVPVLFILSFVFWAFIWHSDAIPSAAFPAAQINWELASKNTALLYSSTFTVDGDQARSVLDSEFMRAIHPTVIGSGFGVTVVLFAVLSGFGLPVFLVYGFIRGIGNLPHYMILEVVGALIGRYYFQKKFGSTRFLRIAPTILAGYFTGVGLIGMATIAMKLIKSAISAAPF